jgi:hypothetical protein
MTAIALAAPHLSRDEARLLSRDVDGIGPWLDPAEGIDSVRVEKVAAVVYRSPDEVRKAYETLAERFPVTLEWSPTAT